VERCWKRPQRDPTTGMLATTECPRHFGEVFVRGTDPLVECTHANDDYTGGGSELDPSYSGLPFDLDRAEGRIDLYICAETGLVAGPACSNVVKRTFEIGEEPLHHCRPELHRGPPGLSPSLLADPRD